MTVTEYAYGTATDNSHWVGYPFSNCFDNNEVTYFNQDPAPNPWIGTMDYGSGVSHIINLYTIQGYSTFTPSEWSVYGSNNGSSWDLLDSRSGESFTPSEIKTYRFENTTAYRYYKFVFTGGENKAIIEVELKYDDAPPTPAVGGVSMGSANAMMVGM